MRKSINKKLVSVLAAAAFSLSAFTAFGSSAETENTTEAAAVSYTHLTLPTNNRV